MERLSQRCHEELIPLAERVRRAHAQLWNAVEKVCALADPTPYYRHVTDLATSLAVAQTMLIQASGDEADDLDRELAVLSVDKLDERAERSLRAIDGHRARRGLKAALRRRLE